MNTRRKVYTIYTNIRTKTEIKHVYQLIIIKSTFTKAITYFVLNVVYPYKYIFLCEIDIMICFHVQLKHLEPKTESLKMINPKKTNEFEYSDQVSNDLLEREVFFDLMATDYRGLKRRKPPINN